MSQHIKGKRLDLRVRPRALICRGIRSPIGVGLGGCISAPGQLAFKTEVTKDVRSSATGNLPRFQQPQYDAERIWDPAQEELDNQTSLYPLWWKLFSYSCPPHQTVLKFLKPCRQITIRSGEDARISDRRGSSPNGGILGCSGAGGDTLMTLPHRVLHTYM